MAGGMAKDWGCDCCWGTREKKPTMGKPHKPTHAWKPYEQPINIYYREARKLTQYGQKVVLWCCSQQWLPRDDRVKPKK